MRLTWQVTDRANRVWFWFLLAVAVTAGVSVVWGDPQLWVMAGCAVSLFQVWRLANERIVEVSVDAEGITKRLGNDTWRREWSQLQGVELRRVWGTDQLVLSGAAATAKEWSYSNKLFGLARVGPGGLAVQVAAGQLPAVRDLLAHLAFPARP